MTHRRNLTPRHDDESHGDRARRSSSSPRRSSRATRAAAAAAARRRRSPTTAATARRRRRGSRRSACASPGYRARVSPRWTTRYSTTANRIRTSRCRRERTTERIGVFHSSFLLERDRRTCGSRAAGRAPLPPRVPRTTAATPNASPCVRVVASTPLFEGVTAGLDSSCPRQHQQFPDDRPRLFSRVDRAPLSPYTQQHTTVSALSVRSVRSSLVSCLMAVCARAARVRVARL